MNRESPLVVPEQHDPSALTREPVRQTTKALVYRGPVKKSRELSAAPGIAALTRSVVQNVKTTISRSDRHIPKDDASRRDPGSAVKDKSVGVLHEVGSGVTAFHPGDRVIVSCISSCGKCEYCRRGMHSYCSDGLVWRAL